MHQLRSFSSGAACSVAKNFRGLLAESRNHSQRNRINITSSDLCDDVVKRLQPSFASAKPFDIIDINPGVCLLSAKLHKALKPRRHILVEPDKKQYGSYIDELVGGISSRYRYVPVLSKLFGARAAEYLPDQKPPVSESDSVASINDTLLVLANFTNLKAIGSRSEDPLTAIHRYINKAINQEYSSFHHYGLVRMLAWLPDEVKATYLPRLVDGRGKPSLKLDLVAQVNEIAGRSDTRMATRGTRIHELAIQSEQLAAQRARDAGAWSSPARQPPPSSPAWHELGPWPDAVEQLRKLPDRLAWHDELLVAYDAWDKRSPANVVEPIRSVPRDAASKAPKNLRSLRSKLLCGQRAKNGARGWAKRQIDLDDAETSLSKKERATPEERIHLLRLKAELRAEMETGRPDLARVARQYIDDRRGFTQQPPLLQWDRRTAEPLLVDSNDFYPAQDMALVDIRPQPGLVAKLSDLDKRVCLEYLCSLLFRKPTQSVAAGLETVVQGGLDDFLERVPDLFNPSKGGNPDLSDLRVRCLSVDLLVQLALALETWPFRLPTHEMLMSIGMKKQITVFDEG